MVKPLAKSIFQDFILSVRGPKRLTTPDPRPFRIGLVLRGMRGNRWAKKLKGSLYSSHENHEQNSIAKISYLENHYKKQWKAHGKYLAREGAQKIGEPGRGFNQTTEDINIAKTLEEWQNAEDKRIWKIILSPEMGNQLDLKEHVRAVMEKVEIDLKTKLEWVAIDHYNTDNHHAHIVIRGVREDGLELRIAREYLKEGVRARSRQEATRTLGLQQEKDILERRQQAISRMYVTELDREIARKIDFVNRTIEFYQLKALGLNWDKVSSQFVENGWAKQPTPSSLYLTADLETEKDRLAKVLGEDYAKILNALENNSDVITLNERSQDADRKVRDAQILGRLQFLEKHSLATRIDIYSWKVNSKFMDHLKEIQLQNDIIKSIYRHEDQILDKDVPAIMNNLPEVGDKVLGRLVSSGVSEVNEDSRYILIEGVDKQIHYVLTTASINMKRDTKLVQNNDIVFLECKEFHRETGQVTLGDLAKVGLDAPKVLQKLCECGVVRMAPDSDRCALFERKISAVSGVLKSVFSENAEKIQGVLESSRTVKYIDLKSAKDFTDIKQFRDVHPIDRYIVDIVEQCRGVPKHEITDTQIRTQFLDVARGRAEYLRQLNIIKQDWTIDRELLNRHFEKVRGITRELTWDGPEMSL